MLEIGLWSPKGFPELPLGDPTEINKRKSHLECSGGGQQGALSRSTSSCGSTDLSLELSSRADQGFNF